MISYVTSQGARIRKEGRRLIVQGRDFQNVLFTSHLEQLIVFGNVSITAPALLTLLKESIDTVFLRADGRYMGRLSSPEPLNAVLRKRQFDLCDDEAFRVRIGRSIVQAKIRNQATMLSRIRRSRSCPEAGAAAAQLRRYAARVAEADTCAALRGIEGRSAALYFRHLPHGFVEDWQFTHRVRRPPTDPVNCVLSFLYTMLTNRCYAAIRIVGLDPQPGIVHDLSYGRYNLPLDLIEEFRTMLGDALTLSLFNMKMLNRDSFHTTEEQDPEIGMEADGEAAMRNQSEDPFGFMPSESDPEDRSSAEAAASSESRPRKPAVRLGHDALKTVIAAFSRKMETSFFHPQAEREMTYAEAIVFQARQLRRVIDGSADSYVPLMLR
ncbi:MAG: CRISPR-associated endonuclease Cas1 [Desulfovibrionaceae bacterium]|nr:CRISPR-associated endonuclease Cas1 [Desulfovibrionaceae bacterium]